MLCFCSSVDSSRGRLLNILTDTATTTSHLYICLIPSFSTHPSWQLPLHPFICPTVHSSTCPSEHTTFITVSSAHQSVRPVDGSLSATASSRPTHIHRSSFHPSNWKLISSHSILLQFSIRSLLICHPLVHFSWSFPSINRLSFVQLQNMHPSLHKAITSFVNYSPISHLPIQSSNVHPSMPACIHNFFHHCTHPSI